VPTLTMPLGSATNTGVSAGVAAKPQVDDDYDNE